MIFDNVLVRLHLSAHLSYYSVLVRLSLAFSVANVPMTVLATGITEQYSLQRVRRSSRPKVLRSDLR